MSDSPDQSPAPNQRGLVTLFGFTVLLSAALVFLIQLLFARLLLPQLGGTAAVWNTSMVFYQAVLLAAYGYGHVISTRLNLRAQIAVHGLVLLLPFLVLPPAIAADWIPPAGSDPTLWVLGILAAGVGLPFFAVATTSPLLQKWFAGTRHPRAGDPYFLYAASNVGSLAGLLSYPFLIERMATLKWQANGWAIGYGLVVVVTALCAWKALRNAAPSAIKPVTAVKAPALPWRRRAKWMACAAVPSSLMLSVTSYISSDLAAVPLLWVMPLALYLITFIVAFSRRPAGEDDVDSTRRIAPLLLLAVSVAIAAGFNSPLGVMIALHLLAFFVLAFVCHRKAARDRPDPEYLTSFYFCLSLGGFLGGAFTSLLAPRLFNGTLEYHLMLIAAAALIVTVSDDRQPAPQKQRRPWGLPGFAAMIAIVIWSALGQYVENPVLRLLGAAVPAAACLLLARRPAGFAIGVGAILLSSYFFPPGDAAMLHVERSYFGIHRVFQRPYGYRWLIHGSTLHGVQN
ncbi:MAG TPA: hypothetical protein VHM91_07815, partial [Verrucomicrobiales bacterium]|nr:hypothetical protein [Verrucomicrobiales bacterium]